MLKRKYVAINFIIALLTLIIQYNGICTIKAINATPVLTLSFTIVLSMFLTELSSFFLGLAFGVIMDAISTTGFGFNSIVFPLICLAVSFIAHYLFNNNIKSTLVLSSVISFFYLTVRFLIFYSSVNAIDTLTYLIKTGLPSAVLTAVFSAIIYFLEKKFFNNTQNSR